MYLKRRIRPQSIFWVLSLFVAQILATFLLLPAHQAKAATDPWYYNSSFQYRKKITIDGMKIQGSLSNFPVLISIIDGGLASKAQSNGNDILFADANGVKLDHEIESFNGATGDLKAWVKVPALSNSVNTAIYMYYGNPGASSQQNKTAVWDGNFKMVQHLHETAGNHLDSTVNANTGTPVNGVNQNATGKIDGADTFDGVNDYVTVPDSASLNPGSITVESWMYPTSFDAHDMFVTKGSSSVGRMDYDLRTVGGIPRFGFYDGSAWRTVSAGSILTLNNWHHIVGTYDGNNLALYVDGILKNSAVIGVSLPDTVAPFIIGNYGWDLAYPFNGSLDEIRISGNARDADWVKTEYNNQSMPVSFYSLSAQEQVAPSTGFNSSMLLIISVMSFFAGAFLLKQRYLRQPS